jgi:hypothetical protein
MISHVPAVLGALLSALLWTVPAAAAPSAPPTGPQVAVATPEALQAAYRDLSAARGGGTIVLAAGFPRQGAIRLGEGGGNPVHVTSADPARPATVSQLWLNGARNVWVSNLAVVHAPQPGRAAWESDFGIYESSGVQVAGVSFRGVARRYAATQGQVTADLGEIRFSEDIVFAGNAIANYHHGLLIRESTDLVLDRNDISRMTGDGIRMGGVQRVTIAGNTFRDWLGSDHEVNHDDMIQLWTTNTTLRSRGITVTGNTFDTSNGVATQTLFFGNESLRDGTGARLYADIDITGNLVYGGHYHGLSVVGVNGGEISGNTVIWNDGAVMDVNDTFRTLEPAITVSASRNMRVAGNIASRIVVEGSTNVTQSGNAIVTYAPSSPMYVGRHLSGVTDGGGAGPRGWRVRPESPLAGHAAAAALR